MFKEIWNVQRYLECSNQHVKCQRVKNAYQIRHTVRCVFEAPRVLETVQYMSRMKAISLLIPKVTLGSEIGGLDQKI